MHDLNDHNKTKDPFSDYFRQQLDEHTLPVEPESWELIDSTLKRHAFRKKAIAATLLAAAVFSGLVLLIPSWNSSLPEEVAEVISTLEEVVEPGIVVAPTAETATSSEAIRVEQPVAVSLIARNEATAATSPILEPSDSEQPEPEAEPLVSRQESEDEVPVLSETMPLRNEDILPTDEKNYRRSQQRNRGIHQKRKEKSDWLVAARVGSASGAKLDLSFDYDGDASPPMYSDDGGKYGNFMLSDRPAIVSPDQLDQKQVATMDHNIPLSFGLLVRKQLTPLFAIESGLQYTFLSSKLTYSNYLYRRGDRKLHYLGIPVNVVATVVNKNRWELYLSGGGMLEKGLREINTYHTVNQLHEQTFTEKQRIDGLQWSLHLSVGASYRLFDRTSLYVEPLLSYYFDNDQPESYRTDNKLTVGVAAGLRFAF